MITNFKTDKEPGLVLRVSKKNLMFAIINNRLLSSPIVLLAFLLLDLCTYTDLYTDFARFWTILDDFGANFTFFFMAIAVYYRK